MANFKSAMCEPSTGYRPPITGAIAGQLLAVRGQVSLPATLALNDIVELVPLPEGHVPVFIVVDSGQLDTNVVPLIEMDFGLANALGTDLTVGTLFIDGTTVGQDGGVAFMDQETAPRLASSTSSRNVAAKVMAAAATPNAAVLGCTLFYRPAGPGE